MMDTLVTWLVAEVQPSMIPANLGGLPTTTAAWLGSRASVGSELSVSLLCADLGALTGHQLCRKLWLEQRPWSQATRTLIGFG